MNWKTVTIDSVPDDRFVLGWFGKDKIHSIEFEVYEGKLYAWNDEGEVYIDLPSHWTEQPKDPE